MIFIGASCFFKDSQTIFNRLWEHCNLQNAPGNILLGVIMLSKLPLKIYLFSGTVLTIPENMVFTGGCLCQLSLKIRDL